MLEGKTANNIVDRYHRIITGDQNQIEGVEGSNIVDRYHRFVSGNDSQLKIEKKRYYWAKNTVTTIEVPGQTFCAGEITDTDRWVMLFGYNGNVDIEFDAKIYKDVPVVSGEVGTRIGVEDPTFSNYPFFIALDDEGGSLVTSTAGEHTIALIAKLGEIELTVEGEQEETPVSTLTYNVFITDANNVIVDNESPDTITISGTQTETIKVNAVFVNPMSFWMMGSLATAGETTFSPDSLGVDKENVLYCTAEELPSAGTISIGGGK